MAWWNRHATRGPAMIPEVVAPPATAVKEVGFLYNSDISQVIYQYGTAFPGDYVNLYRRQPHVRTVVDFLSTNVAQLNLKVFGRVGDDDRIELDGHPLSVLLRRPNPDTTKFRLFRDLVADIALQDVGYWQKIRQGGQVVALIRVPYSRLDVSTSDTGDPIYRHTVTGRLIPRTDLVIFRGYHPDGNPWGVSPAETLRRVLAEDWAAVTNREGFWRNAARRDGVIQRPLDAPEWSDVARSRFRQDWQARHAGPDATRTPVLEEGMTWVADSFSPHEAEYIEGRRLTFEEVCRAYRVQPALFGVGEASGNSAVESFHRQLYQDTLGPWLNSIEDEIELQLLPELDRTPAAFGRVYTEFNLSEKLKASFEELAKTLVTAVGVPYMTVNEARSRLNFPKLDGEEWSMPIQPLNVLYGGQPAATVPTATPETAPTEQEGTPELRPVAASGELLAKASVPRAVEARRTTAAQVHTAIFEKYFREQENAVFIVRARAQGGNGKAEPWDQERWDRKLATLLYAASIPLAADTGRNAARQIGGTYSEPQTLGWLDATAVATARNVNAQTAAELAGTSDPEHIAHVFAVAKGSRAAQLGHGRATSIINFARREAGVQSQNADGRERTKTWVVTARKSRHPHMDGETVPVGEKFSNGLDWPGDAGGDADQTAGCACLLRIN